MSEVQSSGLNEGLLAFLGRAVTPFHAVEAMSEALSVAGFQRLEEGDSWELEARGRYYCARNDATKDDDNHGSRLNAGL